MGILQAPQVLPGQVGVIGAIKYMVTNDSLATVITAGYLNNIDLAVNPVAASDVLGITYLYNLQTQNGTFGFFTVAIVNGVITLSQYVSSGDVLLPVVSGHFAIFNGTSGQIKDSGQAASSLVNPFIVTSPGTLTTNHIAQIADANGSIKDGGVLGTAAAKAASNNALSTLASTAGSGFTAGHIVTAADAAGTIQDSGVAATAVQLSANILANSSAWAGGGTSHGFTITGLTTSSIVIPAIQAQTTGTVYIESYTVTANTLTVTFSADPGAMVLQYVAFIAPQ